MTFPLLERLKKIPRRQALLLGGAGAAAIAGAAVFGGGAGGKDYLKAVKLRDVKALGDGFFVADGWVLTGDDVRQLGGDPDAIARGVVTEE